MPATADVVIIGAGVIGCSTAYHLACLGISDVVVLEMNQVGSGSSGKSASMLSLQARPDELSVRMALQSYARYMQFEEEVGVPVDFRKTGWLSLATEESAPRLRQSAELLRSLGVRTEELPPEEIRHRYPELNVEDLVLGTWGPDDGTIDPHMIMWGYIRRARERGVRLREGVHATQIEIGQGRVRGVVTNEGFIACGTVVNAAGPWAVEVGRWVGLEIPIINAARTIVVTGPFPAIPSDRPFVEDVTVEWYCRPEGPGMLMGMGVVPTEELDVPFRSDMLDGLLDAAVHRIPVLEQATMLTGWTGIRPLTPDGHPILGPVAGVDGLVLNCGWGGMGIIQAPLAGQLAAEVVANGRASTMDIGPLAIERFREGATT